MLPQNFCCFFALTAKCKVYLKFSLYYSAVLLKKGHMFINDQSEILLIKVEIINNTNYEKWLYLDIEAINGLVM